MRSYEVTFIVDPVLSNEEIQSTSQNYVDHLKRHECHVVHVEDMGLRQLAYPIRKRTSGVYYCIEFKVDQGEFINKLELALRRDERIIRFLTVQLDKYGVKYNADKRQGLIGRKKREEDEKSSASDGGDDRKSGSSAKEQSTATEVATAGSTEDTAQSNAASEEE